MQTLTIRVDTTKAVASLRSLTVACIRLDVAMRGADAALRSLSAALDVTWYWRLRWRLTAASERFFGWLAEDA